MRNIEKDKIEMTTRRESMLEEGFRLFAENGIDNVTMQDIADACGIGVATLYRYYSNKLALVVDIGTRKWSEYVDFALKYRNERNADEMTAAEEFALYLDFYIYLYDNHRNLLRFNQNFNIFVQREKASNDQLSPYIDCISDIRKLFYGIYKKAKRDGTLRTDIAADKMFAATSHIMLAVIVRYAQGLLYSADSESDRKNEIYLVKKMILSEYLT